MISCIRGPVHFRPFPGDQIEIGINDPPACKDDYITLEMRIAHQEHMDLLKVLNLTYGYGLLADLTHRNCWVDGF